MTCKEILEMLSAFADDQLSEEDACVVFEHLETCSDCKRELQEIKELQKVLSSLEDVPVPLAFDKRLHDALVREVENMKNEKVVPLKKKKTGNWKAISSVAAVFMVGIFSVILYNNNSGEFNQQDISDYGYQTEQSISDGEEKIDMQLSKSPNLALQDSTEQQEGAQMPKEIGDTLKSDQPSNKSSESEQSAKDVADTQLQNTQPAQSALQSLPYTTSSLSEGEGNAVNSLEDAKSDDTPGTQQEGVQSRMKSEVFATDGELDEYLKSLEDILIDITYEVKNCTFDEQTGIWNMEIDVVTIGEDGSETKEHAVYCGQDGNVWKKEL